MGGTTSTPEPAKPITTSTGTSRMGGTDGMFQREVRTSTRTNPAGLSRMYGYFRCSGCRQQWESSHVYCSPGTVTASYGQDCKKCRITCMPYRVEKIQCSGCGQTTCICVNKQERHIDVNKHHRSDLCAKCKAGLPCTLGF